MDALKLVSAPGADPVSLSEIKSYLRIDASADDTMLTAFITAATNIVEQWIGRRLITQTWQYWMDTFPSTLKFDALLAEGVTEGKLSEYLSPVKALQIPLYPLQSVTHLKTYPDSGVAVVMDSAEYIVDTVHEPGRISLKTFTTWPATVLRPVNGVEIEFVCGYGAAGVNVPTPITQAIKDLVGKFYNNRGCEDTTLTGAAVALLRPYKIMRIG